MVTEQNKSSLVTVAICTYQRPALLERCLKSLVDQQVADGSFTILVVDNAGQKEVRRLAENYQALYVHEAKIGLSAARNRALAETSTTWIFYLDDDAITYPDLVKNFLELVKKSAHISAIGGRFEHYFASPPPPWLLRYYDTDVRPSERTSLVILQDHEYLLGGIMAFKADLLKKIAGFREDLGMKGQDNGYGEENELQDRLRQQGTNIYYSPKLAMKHLVHPRKLSIDGQVAMAYAHGRDQAKVDSTTANSPLRLVWEYLKIWQFTIPLEILRVVFKPDYFWQNGVISVRSKMAFARGKYGRIHP